MRYARFALACGITVLTGSIVTTALASESGRPAPARQLLQNEIKAMEANGMPESDPKLAMLREDLRQFEKGQKSEPARLNLSETLGDRGGGPANVEGRRSTRVAWDSGPVECEVVPSVLTVDDIRDAHCVSEPQPDGSTLYRAVAPDGTVLSVRFGLDGTVTRIADR